MIVLGDESGYIATQDQQMKIAAMEAMYHTEPTPALLTMFTIPGKTLASRSSRCNCLGCLASPHPLARSRSTRYYQTNREVAKRIQSGIIAYGALQAIRTDGSDTAARATFDEHWSDLGYGLLLKKYRDDVENATGEQIAMAALDTMPDVWPLFWSFRLMIGISFFFIAMFGIWFYRVVRGWIGTNWAVLSIGLAVLPLPWLAIEGSWFIAEYGRQPGVVEGVLPTCYVASSLNFWDLIISLTFFVAPHSVLLVIMIMLMVRIIKAGLQNKLLAASDEGNDSDFVVAALPVTPANKELGS